MRELIRDTETETSTGMGGILGMLAIVALIFVSLMYAYPSLRLGMNNSQDQAGGNIEQVREQ